MYPQSQSARTVWIEIAMGAVAGVATGSQSARTVWIEIPNDSGYCVVGIRHSLRGLCGLKSLS